MVSGLGGSGLSTEIKEPLLANYKIIRNVVDMFLTLSLLFVFVMKAIWILNWSFYTKQDKNKYKQGMEN